MGFRLVPKMVTLNDFERRNGRVVCVISPNSVASEIRPYYVKVVGYILQVKCSPKNLALAIYHVLRYSQGITPSEGV